MFSEFLLSVQKALVPIVVSALAVGLKAVGVEIPVADEYIIAGGLINAGLVFLKKNTGHYFD
jgi:hypothetical protein